MNIDNNYENKKYIRARKRLDELKKYYRHLIAYIVVNIGISAIKVNDIMDRGDTFSEAFQDFDVYAVWLFWGIGLAFHTFKVFGAKLFLDKNWEEKKIQEYMNEK